MEKRRWLGDLSESDTAGAIVAQAVEQFGGLDVLVSNADLLTAPRFAEQTDIGMMRSIAAIQGAFFRLAQAAMPHLQQGRNPRIVAISSFVAHAFRTNVAVFGIGRGEGGDRGAGAAALAIELAAGGVTVNTVVHNHSARMPDAHAAFTPEQAAARAVADSAGAAWLPDDVAAAVAFLVSCGGGVPMLDRRCMSTAG